MILEDFLKRYHIKLHDCAEKACIEGIRRMSQNPDPHHSLHHVYGLFDELDSFLKNELSVSKHKIDFNVLLSAICWHDVWKGRHHQTSNLGTFIFRELNDGTGSKRLFKLWVKGQGCPNAFQKAVSYCIIKHSRWSQGLPKAAQHAFFPVKTVEARILSDLDGLDAWSDRRLDNLIVNYLERRENFDPKYIVIAKWWFINCIQNATDKKFFYDYARQEFERRKKHIITRCVYLWNTKSQYFDVEDPRYKKYLNFNLNKLNKEIRDEFSPK